MYIRHKANQRVSSISLNICKFLKIENLALFWFKFQQHGTSKHVDIDNNITIITLTCNPTNMRRSI